MIAAVYYSYVESPLGRIVVTGDGDALSGLYMAEHKGWRGPADSWEERDKPFRAVQDQLAEYFAGERKTFDLRLDLSGTPFQKQVWNELLNIPFGATTSYAALSRRLGKPAALRAVGNAIGRNPVSIVVPCHRVIGTSGRLTGYAGGLIRKQWLLDLESKVGCSI